MHSDLSKQPTVHYLMLCKLPPPMWRNNTGMSGYVTFNTTNSFKSKGNRKHYVTDAALNFTAWQMIHSLHKYLYYNVLRIRTGYPEKKISTESHSNFGICPHDAWMLTYVVIPIQLCRYLVIPAHYCLQWRGQMLCTYVHSHRKDICSYKSLCVYFSKGLNKFHNRWN